jgi:hypothetical protein
MDASLGFTPQSAQRLMGLLFDLATKLTEATLSSTTPQTPPDAFRQIRTAQLNAWGDYFQELMRTPEFLDAVKQWTALNVQFRKQMSDFLGQMQHEFQGASRQDIDQLMLSMRHLERRVVEGVEQLTARLDRLDGCLASLRPTEEGNGQTDAETPPELEKKKKRKPPAPPAATE